MDSVYSSFEQRHYLAYQQNRANIQKADG
jgi:hypothetical protein